MKKTILFFVLSALIISCAPTQSSRYREGSNVGQQAGLTVADARATLRAAGFKMRRV